MESKFIEYLGFVPLFEERGGFLVKIACKEIDFELGGVLNYPLAISKFKQAVDKYLSKKQLSYSDCEQELNRLKLLLSQQPEVFYGTRQVYDLVTLAEDLLASNKKEEVDSNLKEFYKQLDRLIEWDRKIKYEPRQLSEKLGAVCDLFRGVLDFSLVDVKRHYFERANKLGV